MERRPRPPRPRGLTRALFRLPIQLYRLRLGWLLGHRFVLINHVGRRSGRTRQVVLEVVAEDRATGAITVASGFGPTADWYRNLLAHPEVTCQVGLRRRRVRAVPLPPDEGGEVMAGYGRRHPRITARMSRFMGFIVDGSEEDYRAVGREIPFLRLEPFA